MKLLSALMFSKSI